jgi:hypothetical protein
MPISVRDQQLRNEFERLFGFKPDGRNKGFKDFKTKYNNPTLTTPKQRRDFLQRAIMQNEFKNSVKVLW